MAKFCDVCTTEEKRDSRGIITIHLSTDCPKHGNIAEAAIEMTFPVCNNIICGHRQDHHGHAPTDQGCRRCNCGQYRHESRVPELVAALEQSVQAAKEARKRHPQPSSSAESSGTTPPLDSVSGLISASYVDSEGNEIPSKLIVVPIARKEADEG